MGFSCNFSRENQSIEGRVLTNAYPKKYGNTPTFMGLKPRIPHPQRTNLTGFGMARTGSGTTFDRMTGGYLSENSDLEVKTWG